jgi:hypothetical protein
LVGKPAVLVSVVAKVVIEFSDANHTRKDPSSEFLYQIQPGNVTELFVLVMPYLALPDIPVLSSVTFVIRTFLDIKHSRIVSFRKS